MFWNDGVVIGHSEKVQNTAEASTNLNAQKCFQQYTYIVCATSLILFVFFNFVCIGIV